jgi:hypothetical protein
MEKFQIAAMAMGGLQWTLWALFVLAGTIFFSTSSMEESNRRPAVAGFVALLSLPLLGSFWLSLGVGIGVFFALKKLAYNELFPILFLAGLIIAVIF